MTRVVPAAITGLRRVWNQRFCSGQSGYQSCAPDTAGREHDDHYMSDQL